MSNGLKRKPDGRRKQKLKSVLTAKNTKSVAEIEKLKTARNSMKNQLETAQNALEKAIGYCMKRSIPPHITNERLAHRGYYDISKAYKSMHSI